MKALSMPLVGAFFIIADAAMAGPIKELSERFRDSVRQSVQYHRDYIENRRYSFLRSDYRNRRSLANHSKRYRNKKKRRSFSRSSVPKSIKATGRKTFVFNPRGLHWGAYDANGRLVNSGRASGGKHYCADVKRRCRTPVGSFSVYRKGSASCRSSKYPLGRGGAPMPHCMFFYKGFAIHGSPNVPNYNASHGCVRVMPSDARWLHRNFMDHGTKVIVKPY